MMNNNKNTSAAADTRVLTASDLPDEFDVAVVVFAKARGCDEGDAADRVQQAVSRALRTAEPLPLPHRGSDVEGAVVTVYDVMEVGAAAGNGYLWTRSTEKARRNYSTDTLTKNEER